MSDEEIARLVQKGETDKYGEIIDRYQKKLYYYLKGVTNQSEEIVEDLVEDTLIKAYENLQAFDNRRKFSSWIYRIAHNKAIDFFRKSKEQRLTDWQEESIPDGKRLIEDLLIKTETENELLAAVERLEPKYREIIWLYYYENKSYDEIADVLRTTTNNIGVMLNRGKEKLKKLLSYSVTQMSEKPTIR